ncbi:MAG: flavin reductase family protein [Treponema sp.]|jgi:flavin reductase (DIM6/NTAB) family NADH-FMN oxidoreductase RutF|nr:flavin reductase family protein [Treponema sp.]
MSGKKVSLKISSTILSPAPAVMVSCRGLEAPCDKDNIISIAMTSTLSTIPPLVHISIKDVRFSYLQIKQSMEYVINFAGENLCYALDWCGIKSGKNVDKFAECQLTPEPIANLSTARAIGESPLSMGCRVIDIVKAGSYEVFVGEVVSVEADPEILDGSRKPDFHKIALLSYTNGKYYTLGRHMGDLGFSGRAQAAAV